MEIHQGKRPPFPKGKGGIDWWRYRTVILLPKLIPFCTQNNLILQQDLAPSHAAEVNQELLQECNIEVLEWAGNSPDLNMIEPAWPWMKRGAGHYDESKKESPQIWQNLWDTMPQERIRRWIERLGISVGLSIWKVAMSIKRC